MNSKLEGLHVTFSTRLPSIPHGKDPEVTLEAQGANLHFPQLK